MGENPTIADEIHEWLGDPVSSDVSISALTYLIYILLVRDLGVEVQGIVRSAAGIESRDGYAR